LYQKAPRPSGEFVAGLDVIHRIIFAPGPKRNGYATLLNPPGPEAAGNTILVVLPTIFRARAAAASIPPKGPAHVFAKTARSDAARLSTILAKTRAH
jgi:hypothetical protein